jgi:DNA processing protein
MALAGVVRTADWARPPPPLYVRGDLPLEPGVAIVGSRLCTDEGARFAQELAKAAVDDGIPVWSGGAKGIDCAAHCGALDAGGHTVAVLTGCFDNPFPDQHGPLFKQICDGGGALISLQARGEARGPADFLIRNLLMACLTRATIVVEASHGRSGAMHMARVTHRVGHSVLVVPRAPWDRNPAANALLTQGAFPITSIGATLKRLKTMLRSPTQIAFAAPRSATRAAAPHREATAPPTLDADARAVLSALTTTPTHADDVCRQTSLPYPRVSRSLLTLTLRGDIVQTSAGACLVR